MENQSLCTRQAHPGPIDSSLQISSIDILLLCIFLLLKIVPELNVRSQWSWFLKDAFSLSFTNLQVWRPISLAGSLTTSMHLKLVSSVKSRKESLLWYVHVIHFWINVLIIIYHYGHGVSLKKLANVLSPAHRCYQFDVYNLSIEWKAGYLKDFVLVRIMLPRKSLVTIVKG